MATIFNKRFPRIAVRMAANNREVAMQLLRHDKFAKASTGHWLAWNPADLSRVAVLLPDHPQGEPCKWIDVDDEDATIEKVIEYVESGRFDQEKDWVLNLFIEDVQCKGKHIGTNDPCGRTAYRCKRCGKEGCAHLHAGQCANQCFAGITCLHCGTVGQIGELRDGHPNPERNLSAFYQTLLDGKPSQFELRLVEHRKALHPQIWLDGVHFGQKFAIDFRALFNSLCEEGEYFIFTCSCGEPACDSIDSGVNVRFAGNEVIWSTHEPISCRIKASGRDLIAWNASGREYHFDRQAMIDNINQALDQTLFRCLSQQYDLFNPLTEMSLDVALAQVAGEPFDESKKFSKIAALPTRIEDTSDWDDFFQQWVEDLCAAKHGSPDNRKR